MTSAERIRNKIKRSATTTTADACDMAHLDDAPAIAAILNSRIVSSAIERGEFSAETLPLPPISRAFEVQLEILWREFETPGADRVALVGAFDRIVAELYGLTVDDLMHFELESGQAAK